MPNSKYILMNYADNEHLKVGYALVKLYSQHDLLSEYAEDAKVKLAQKLEVDAENIRIIDFKFFHFGDLMLIDV